MRVQVSEVKYALHRTLGLVSRDSESASKEMIHQALDDLEAEAKKLYIAGKLSTIEVTKTMEPKEAGELVRRVFGNKPFVDVLVDALKDPQLRRFVAFG